MKLLLERDALWIQQVAKSRHLNGQQMNECVLDKYLMNWKSSSCPFQTTFLSAYVVNSCGLWAADLIGVTKSSQIKLAFNLHCFPVSIQ